MQGLNGMDSNLLLKALEQRNATALIPVQSGHIQSVHQIDKNKLQVTLKTGDSMTLHLEHGPTAYAAAPSNAIETVKAMKYLKEKGINTTNIDESEMLVVADITRHFTNESKSDSGKVRVVSSYDPTDVRDEREIVNDFKEIWTNQKR